MKGITFGIPAYNEQESIKSVLGDLELFLKKNITVYEIIVVDDGSKDKTAKIIERYFPTIKLIKHLENKGYGASIKTIAKNAKYDTVFWMDADGQHQPKEILKLTQHIGTYDFIVGKRNTITQTSFFRAPGKKILNSFASYLMEKNIPDLNSGFRITSKKIILDNMHILPDAFSISSTTTLIAFKTGLNVKYETIHMKRRTAGKSTLRPFKDGMRFILLIIRLTILFNPMRIFLPITFLIGLAGLTFGLYGVITTNSLPETAVLLLLGALFMFFFTMISEQLSTLINKHHK